MKIDKTSLLMIELAFQASKALRAGQYREVYKYMLLAGVSPVDALRRIRRDRIEIGHKVNVSYSSDSGYQPWCDCGWHYPDYFTNLDEAQKVECQVLLDRLQKDKERESESIKNFSS